MKTTTIEKDKIYKYINYFNNIKSKKILDIASIDEIDDLLNVKHNKVSNYKIFKYKNGITEVNLYNYKNKLICIFLEKNDKVQLNYIVLYNKDGNKIFERKKVININYLIKDYQYRNFYLDKYYFYKNSKLETVKYIDITNNENILQEIYLVRNNTGQLNIILDKKYKYYFVNYLKIEEFETFYLYKEYEKLFKKPRSIEIIKKFINNINNNKNNKCLSKVYIKDKIWGLDILKLEKYNIINDELFKMTLYQKIFNNKNKELNKIVCSIIKKYFKINNKELKKYVNKKNKTCKIEIKKIKDKIEINYYKFQDKINEIIFSTTIVNKDKIIKKYYFYSKLNKLIKETIIDNEYINIFEYIYKKYTNKLIKTIESKYNKNGMLIKRITKSINNI